MLERLAEIGMHLAEQVGAHVAASMAAINEDKAGDPTRAFATVSRSLRLTLAMEARVDRQILALRKGEPPHDEPSRACRSASAGIQQTSRARAAAPERHESLLEYDPYEGREGDFPPRTLPLPPTTPTPPSAKAEGPA